MGSVLCIGQSAFDITIPLHEPIIENRKYVFDEEIRCGGGPALNAAYLSAKWGLPTFLMSRLGHDTYGDYLQSLMKDIGIKADYLVFPDNYATPHSYIFPNMDAGTRTLFNHPGVLEKVTCPLPEHDIKVIHTDGHEDDWSLEAFERYPNAVSLIDAGSARDEVLRVAKKADHLVCSEDFARQYTGKDINVNDASCCEKALKAIEEINSKTVVITLGENGLLYRENGHVKRMRAFQVNAVDSTGAGDVFHGADLYGLYHNLSFTETLKTAAAAAACSVQKVGAQISIPSLADTQSLISSQDSTITTLT